MRSIHPFAVVAVAVFFGCGAAQTTPTTPRSRVAQDLGCTTEATSVQEIGPVPGEQAARWQVRGCGKTAVYRCTKPVRDCWRENEVAFDQETK